MCKRQGLRGPRIRRWIPDSKHEITSRHVTTFPDSIHGQPSELPSAGCDGTQDSFKDRCEDSFHRGAQAQEAARERRASRRCTLVNRSDVLVNRVFGCQEKRKGQEKMQPQQQQGKTTVPFRNITTRMRKKKNLGVPMDGKTAHVQCSYATTNSCGCRYFHIYIQKYVPVSVHVCARFSREFRLFLTAV